MRFILVVTLFTLGIYSPLKAQYTYFPQQGTISYEKTIFIKNLVKRYGAYAKDENSKQMMLSLLDRLPENHVFKKKASFSDKEVLFEHVKEDYTESVRMMMQMGVIESGIITYQNLGEKRMKSSFDLGGQSILVDDQVVDVKWKITNEYRSIAGYNCRRANGLVMDSIYVVAFYTDEIPVSAGPSSFNGLPGMILGLAVPELHYNIFATKVDLTPLSPGALDIGKKKAKAMTRKEVYDQLNAVLVGFLGEKMFNLVMAGYYL
ncbi:GLPGLI family protein [Sphingobacterium olei]|uniref:GLPGLI family protein n=1 Tax=Sphingobacterium olei TaxID=2571155 RepID=A0A4U0P1Y2_9SPHI|nr:GLPGLI family protein [Sphingobacterium olei]TJZ61219.1 GLPGLI family protein [Sphingobacterium olei]